MPSADPAPWATTPDGVVLWLRLTPKGGRDALEGVETLADGRRVVKARVRAAPEKGRANDALAALLAKALGRPAGAVDIRSGATGRLKQMFVSGDPETLKAALERLLSTQG